MRFAIYNATIFTPHDVIEDGYILVEDGKILEVGQGSFSFGGKKLDAEGLYVFPGFIDVHNDSIEKEIEPRVNVRFPMEIALFETDKKLAFCGITTVYYSISFAEGELGLRSNSLAQSLVKLIKKHSQDLLINSKVHLRFEITNFEGVPYVLPLLEEGAVDLISFMDHTPGQGQMKDLLTYKDFFSQNYKMSEEDIEELVSKKLNRKERVKNTVEALATKARKLNVPIASHDDDCKEKVLWMKELGAVISEFPTTFEALKAATELGIKVVLGAPNIVRGQSHTGNLRGREVIHKGFGDIICSDYSPSSILHALFVLDREKISPLTQALKMATINPAKALGIDLEKGSIYPGKDADIVIVDPRGPIPRIRYTLCKGKIVYFSQF